MSASSRALSWPFPACSDEPCPVCLPPVPQLRRPIGSLSVLGLLSLWLLCSPRPVGPRSPMERRPVAFGGGNIVQGRRKQRCCRRDHLAVRVENIGARL